MNEIEVKVLKIDKDEIEQKLKNIGAKIVKDENQTNIRFDTKDYYLRNNLRGYLRIRVAENNLTGETVNTLTLKKNISRKGFRVNEETETLISDVEQTAKILESLGYLRKRPGKKHRVSYKYDDILFEIDTWDKSIYPYSYLEIEVQDESRLDFAINLLGIERSNVTSKSIDELIKDL